MGNVTYSFHSDYFLVVNKHNGTLISDKVYTSEGRAKAAIKKWGVSDAADFTVVPLPSQSILKAIAEGASYATLPKEVIS